MGQSAHRITRVPQSPVQCTTQALPARWGGSAVSRTSAAPCPLELTTHDPSKRGGLDRILGVVSKFQSRTQPDSRVGKGLPRAATAPGPRAPPAIDHHPLSSEITTEAQTMRQSCFSAAMAFRLKRTAPCAKCCARRIPCPFSRNRWHISLLSEGVPGMVRARCKYLNC